MALNAYLHLKGVKSGDILGSSTVKGREGRIVVMGASHEVLSPRDPVSGLPTGRRMHKPYVITKEVDRASPLLYQVLTTNETLSEFDLQFWRTAVKSPTSGSEVQHYTVRLTNAQIADIRFTQPNTRDPNLARLAEYEEVTFTYQKIEWLWTEGGIATQDDWLART